MSKVKTWKWEHAHESASTDVPWIEEELERRGNEGWELVTAYESDGLTHLYFKRMADA